MRPRSRLMPRVILASTAYFLAATIFGPRQLVDALVTITAIDHWHPNWPAQATVDTAAEVLQALALLIAGFTFIVWITIKMTAPRRHSGIGVGSPTAGSAGAAAGSALAPATLAGLPAWNPSREEFHAELCDSLRQAGVSSQAALEAVDTAMATHAQKGRPADWAEAVRGEALTLVGFTTMALRLNSREDHIDATAEFLRDYGYRVLHLHQAGGHRHPEAPSDVGASLNFDGLLIWFRTDAHAAESALIELLSCAHAAYTASMDDNGAPATSGKVEKYATWLDRVATKLALRGFVPPELDAEVGRDGIASADELKRWATAQVVTTCSPMAQAPLPTIERDIAGGR